MERMGDGSNSNLHKAAAGKRKIDEVVINEQGVDEINQNPDSDNVGLSKINTNCISVSSDRLGQSFQLPLGSIAAIMGKKLPSDAMVSKDSKELIQVCAAEFISFITAEANAHCQKDHRRILTADDIISALSALGFDNHVECLKLYLNRYRQISAKK